MATRMKPIFGIDITENKGETRMNGERYGIYFPCYELDAIEQMTGLRAQ